MTENAQIRLKNNLNTMDSQTKEWIENVEFYKEELASVNSLISDCIDTTTTDDLNHKMILFLMIYNQSLKEYT